MPFIDKYPTSSFCWLELATTDQGAAKKFYSNLFGWVSADVPMGPGEVYTLFRIGDRDAGTAAYTLRKEQQGMPPNWSIYIAVENVDASTKRASELGGKVCMQPFDVFDMGRMAVVQDPTGAAFCLWQSKQKANGVTGVDGTLCWADLNTPDPEAGEEVLFQPVGMEIREVGARFIGLPAHQKWRAVHRRPSSSRTPRRRASPLACIHSGVRL